MSEKREMIIEQASTLFAKNGFEATSVQEITDACGISKGSFYLSFKSKESLLFAIFEYFSKKLLEQVEGVFSEEGLTERERFERSLRIYFEEIAKYSNFILMQLREQTNPVNEEMLQLMTANQRTTYRLQHKLLKDLYGEQTEACMPDAITILNGIIKGYMEIIVFTKEPLDFEGLARFLAGVMDSIMADLKEPFLVTDQLVMNSEQLSGESREKIIKEVQRLRLQYDEEDDSYISLDVIEQELRSDRWRKPVIRGMLAMLADSDEVRDLTEKLNDWMDR